MVVVGGHALYCVIALMQMGKRKKRKFVRSGIRTHAYRSRLRPERSALDHSAILTPMNESDPVVSGITWRSQIGLVTRL